MKKLLILLALFSLSMNCSYAKEDEIRDFAIRIGAGLMQGVGDKSMKEISAYADMYLFSQQTRMLFGFSLYDTNDTDIPTMSIQTIGIEQNMQLLAGEIFIGVTYNKTYLESENSGYDPRRGEAYHLGYKYPVEKYEDLVVTIGQQYRPLSRLNPNTSAKLNRTTEYLRVAYQWYF